MVHTPILLRHAWLLFFTSWNDVLGLRPASKSSSGSMVRHVPLRWVWQNPIEIPCAELQKKLRYPPHMGQSIAESIWGNMFYCWSWKAPKTNPRYRDLAFLCQEVCSALRCGQILPGPEDDASEVYGPSIYTVNEQYIKPVTQQAGKMSWALMRHPDGLDCELFISHAWQEGVFEFLAKVRHSWPRGVQTAWCCMLANPQNLDISSFLQSPKTSPFAVALEASKVMLVVPNRHQSVYTRLWCSYEAYLAQEDGKTILIANSSNFSQILSALVWLVLAAIFGMALGILATFLEAGESFTVPALTILVCGFSLVIYNNLLRRVLHFVGVMLCWICVMHNFGGVFGGWPVVSSACFTFHAGMIIPRELRIFFAGDCPLPARRVC